MRENGGCYEAAHPSSLSHRGVRRVAPSSYPQYRGAEDEGAMVETWSEDSDDEAEEDEGVEGNWRKRSGAVEKKTRMRMRRRGLGR